ncbi:ATP-grasp domain-containing protein [Spiroplasma tabanidicola]|uniref:5-(Carboxyamino)imidazole ribonucleotide synthase n=1 Tax=Spiroplasma tabanidicola TaxID=324079 RepID=A0A6I6C5U4_9MOLU|nr:ATP-grasp domain-containing protein [Spiroplasma tabanidicola]QGS52267.1 5-(carboxyamino)imidazole ribonucleotide synthase [Spiroplasma tabanidicola]
MKVGLIGGGQLARMLIESSKENEFVVLEPNKNNSCLDLEVEILNSNYNDKEAVKNLFDKTETITYEFENIDFEVLKEHKNSINPSLNFLSVSKNRFKEKNFASSYGLTTVNFFKIKNSDEISELINNNKLNYPFILKTNTGGYDGKGQYLIKEKKDYEFLDFNNIDFIIEELCNFDFETSLIVTRSIFNQIYFFPTPINEHKDGILMTSKVLTKKSFVDKRTKRLIKNILQKENIVGTIAFEFFVKDKKLFFNEMAPRVHNTGHYTINGCNVSQFRNHILAVTGKKIIKPKLIYKTIMINLLGKNIYKEFDIQNIIKFDYKKSEAIDKRKMGHINIINKNKKNLLKDYQSALNKLEEKNE